MNSGQGQTTRNLGILINKIEKAVTNCIFGTLRDISDDSALICPVDTGQLRRSREANDRRLKKNKNSIYGQVEYIMPYAEIVHENRSDAKFATGGSHFLLKSYNQNVANFEHNLKHAVKEVL